ncbi:MAG: prolyl oligopeptidase family serine peptidase [Ignavibacteriae bacterium]|nr:prolyl oligopeptidase family serine peptidase [Ignavibacteriota bacterium]
MMHSLSSTLFHRVLIPERSRADRHPTILYIHGRGADEEDLLGLSGALDERFMSIAVRAPFPFDFGGYTWYEILDATGKPEEKQFVLAYGKLAQFVEDALTQYPIDPQQLFLFGFSMGAVMSYALALTKPALFRGVVAHSGYLAEGTQLEYSWKNVAGRDFFIAHGCSDYTIPVQAARRARLLLEEASARLTYKEYDFAHQIGNESLADIAQWLSQRINPPVENLHAR